MADGYYAKLTERIKQLQENDAVVIRRESIASCLDLSEMPREELESRCTQAMACVALYQNGYRSVVRGSGLFIDYQKTDNPIFLSRLVENQELDINQKTQVLNVMRRLKENSIRVMPDYAQYALGVDEDGNLSTYQEITSEEIVEMLERMAL